MLYFKYLLALNPLEIKKGLKYVPKTPKMTGKVLLVDDEWKKVWDDIFQNYFQNTSIEFESLKIENTDNSFEKILSKLKISVDSYNPDLIILDLRLLANDHNNLAIDEFTGIKLLQEIHKINAGIQVIMLTASNKSIILDKLYSYNIVGYINKEHPNYQVIPTKDNFKKLNNLIDNALKNKYLKDVWNIQKKILELKLFNENNNPKLKEIKAEIELIFEILNSPINKKFRFATLSIFKCFEILVSMFIEEKYVSGKRFAYWINTNDKIKFFAQDTSYPKETTDKDKNDTTINKIRILVYHKLDIKDKDIHDELQIITRIRNDIIHQDEPNVNQNDIVKWFNLVYIVLKAFNGR